MASVIRVAHAGVDATVETDPRYFSLFTDGTNNHILVKEERRGSETIASFDSKIIEHNLGYAPVFAVNVQIGSEYQWSYGFGIYSSWRIFATTTTLNMINLDDSSRVFGYFILHDLL